MAKKKARKYNIAPIHPSVHFILFLTLALILIVVVTAVMNKTSQESKAALMCPDSQKTANELANLSQNCKYGIMQIKNNNGCLTWVCRLPLNPSPKQFKK